jgi:hypothetical protein
LPDVDVEEPPTIDDDYVLDEPEDEDQEEA